MSDVISVRVSRELKEKMKKYRVNWSSEIRRFIEGRIKTLEFLDLLDSIEEKARRRRTMIDSTVLIREERENR